MAKISTFVYLESVFACILKVSLLYLMGETQIVLPLNRKIGGGRYEEKEYFNSCTFSDYYFTYNLKLD